MTLDLQRHPRQHERQSSWHGHNGRAAQNFAPSHMMKNRISLNLPLPSSHCDHHAAQDICSLMLAHAGAVSTRGRAPSHMAASSYDAKLAGVRPRGGACPCACWDSIPPAGGAAARPALRRLRGLCACVGAVLGGEWPCPGGRGDTDESGTGCIRGPYWSLIRKRSSSSIASSSVVRSPPSSPSSSPSKYLDPSGSSSIGVVRGRYEGEGGGCIWPAPVHISASPCRWVG